MHCPVSGVVDYDVERVKPQKNDADFRGCLKSSQAHYTRSPNPLKKGASEFKVPLFKGDLGGSRCVTCLIEYFSNTLLE
jgi:hypothetical protein